LSLKLVDLFGCLFFVFEQGVGLIMAKKLGRGRGRGKGVLAGTIGKGNLPVTPVADSGV
jgi:hypothetical protein